MSKGLRVILHLLQAGSLIVAVLFLIEAALGRTGNGNLVINYAPDQLVTGAIAAGIVSIAFSPALWSLNRGGSDAAAPPQTMGSYDRVTEAPRAAPQPPQPGGAFEPMSSERAPAPPASSYGQPSGPGFGAQPSAGGASPTSPPMQGDSPWGSR